MITPDQNHMQYLNIFRFFSKGWRRRRGEGRQEGMGGRRERREVRRGEELARGEEEGEERKP